MRSLRIGCRWLAGVAVLLPAGGALAQVAPSTDPAVAPAPQPTVTTAKRIFTPADFARFAPRNAYDMLLQVPGFTIRSADQERGLGQASENVLINGQRIANKSGGAIDELQKISAANVERIEIVEAAQLGIAGLAGQVANVIVKATRVASGQFEWRPEFRAHYARPNLFRGSASYSGKSGAVGYTFSVKDQAGRGAYGGPVVITDAAGVVTERRTETLHSESDLVTLQSKFGIDGPGSSVGNLTLAYTPYTAPYYQAERRVRSDGDDRTRTTDQTLDGYYIDLSGDYRFALGPGALKLIGLRHFDHEPVLTTQITRFDSGVPDQGVRFGRDSRIGETVLRGEYGWKMGRNDLQLSLERAYNSLDQRGSLSTLTTTGAFQPIAYPEGSGIVAETRYEAIATLSRPLGAKLDLQIAGGAEISRLARLDGDLPARRFFRPKGSVTLGWRPAARWDVSLKLRRRVGQISFYDFLAQPNLREDRANSGNPDLVPPQSWEIEGEVGHELGPWGKTRLQMHVHRIEDIVDIIPIGEDGEAIGNLPSATRFGAESTSTIQFDPIGWRGAKIDLTLGFETSNVRDPLTNLARPITENQDRWAELVLRHDVPHTQLAWGGAASYSHQTRAYYLTEIGLSSEGPIFASLYVEDKDVFGLTVRATAGNLLNARHRFDRTVYDGRRERDPVAFVQSANQLIGPIFSLSVKGTF